MAREIVPTRPTTKLERHTSRVPGWPPRTEQCITLTTAVRIVRAYGDTLPTPRQVMADFDVCRATAYRWVAALRELNA
jgi:hypothetical protein